MKKFYELINKKEIAVLIAVNRGNSQYYPYKPIIGYMEVNAEFEYESFKVKKFQENEQWSYRLMRNENDSLANWQGRDNAINIMGEDAIIAAEKQVRKNLRSLKNLISEAKLNPVWLNLKPIADSIIEHYKTDFYYHDCKIIHERQPDKFVWIVRKSGTWLILSQSVFNKSLIDDQSKNNSEQRKFYYYNGTNLKQVNINNLCNVYNRLPNQ
jgi:hypothetical protein